jgi:hypothetical protein
MGGARFNVIAHHLTEGRFRECVQQTRQTEYL